MTVDTIRVEESAAETRAVALDSSSRPIGLFISRPFDAGRHARWGEVVEARIAKVSPAQGGAFLELASGEEAFLSSNSKAGLVEGRRLSVRIAAEARRDKLARAAPTEGPVSADAPFDFWRAALPNGGDTSVVRTGPFDDLVEAAFEDALAPTNQIAGGGRLQIHRTPALTSFDIDTAGRDDRGSPAARAAAINVAAAGEAARQMALRGLGGLVVIDCIGPIPRPFRDKAKLAFLEAHAAVSSANADALPASRFGLLEASVEWRWRPVADTLLDETGGQSPETELFEALRDAQREAASSPSQLYELKLTVSARRAWRALNAEARASVANALGPLIRLGETHRSKSVVDVI
ncbi:MAG: ribonuclease E/G [Pseudomonadota bacterium]